MGLINDIIAMKNVQKIKKGGKAYLSISQITGLIVNMTDAKNVLDDETFNKVYKLFQELRKCNTKLELDFKGYCNTAIDIIKRFDSITPYEKISGGNEIEMSFLMNDVRDSINEDIQGDQSTEEKEYIKYLVENSKGILNEELSVKFMKVLKSYNEKGKQGAILEFDDLANKLIEEDKIKAVAKISFLLGVMNSNQIIDEEEMNRFSKDYQNKILNMIS